MSRRISKMPATGRPSRRYAGRCAVRTMLPEPMTTMGRGCEGLGQAWVSAVIVWNARSAKPADARTAWPAWLFISLCHIQVKAVVQFDVYFTRQVWFLL